MSNSKSHWQMIDSGSRVVVNTAEDLWNAAVSYFKWCEDNPIQSKKTLTSGKTQGEKVSVEYVRPFTIKGFCMHASISERYLNDIKDSHAKDSEMFLVLERILYVIHTQNVEGAIVDMYNPIMVTKILGMDKQQDNEVSTVKVEIIGSESSKLANSENEILQNLDFGNSNLENDIIKNLER